MQDKQRVADMPVEVVDRQNIEIIEEAHYETREVPFGRSYKWHPERMVVECDCGEELVFTGTEALTTCQCGTEYGDLVRGIRYREGRLQDEDVHPWDYDVQGQADQHSRDEAAYPEGSPRRYNDITSRGTDQTCS